MGVAAPSVLAPFVDPSTFVIRIPHQNNNSDLASTLTAAILAGSPALNFAKNTLGESQQEHQLSDTNNGHNTSDVNVFAGYRQETSELAVLHNNQRGVSSQRHRHALCPGSPMSSSTTASSSLPSPTLRVCPLSSTEQPCSAAHLTTGARNRGDLSVLPENQGRVASQSNANGQKECPSTSAGIPSLLRSCYNFSSSDNGLSSLDSTLHTIFHSKNVFVKKQPVSNRLDGSPDCFPNSTISTNPSESFPFSDNWQKLVFSIASRKTCDDAACAQSDTQHQTSHIPSIVSKSLASHLHKPIIGVESLLPSIPNDPDEAAEWNNHELVISSMEHLFAPTAAEKAEGLLELKRSSQGKSDCTLNHFIGSTFSRLVSPRSSLSNTSPTIFLNNNLKNLDNEQNIVFPTRIPVSAHERPQRTEALNSAGSNARNPAMESDSYPSLRSSLSELSLEHSSTQLLGSSLRNDASKTCTSKAPKISGEDALTTFTGAADSWLRNASDIVDANPLFLTDFSIASPGLFSPENQYDTITDHAIHRFSKFHSALPQRQLSSDPFVSSSKMVSLLGRESWGMPHNTPLVKNYSKKQLGLDNASTISSSLDKLQPNEGRNVRGLLNQFNNKSGALSPLDASCTQHASLANDSNQVIQRLVGLAATSSMLDKQIHQTSPSNLSAPASTAHSNVNSSLATSQLPSTIERNNHSAASLMSFLTEYMPLQSASTADNNLFTCSAAPSYPDDSQDSLSSVPNKDHLSPYNAITDCTQRTASKAEVGVARPYFSHVPTMDSSVTPLPWVPRQRWSDVIKGLDFLDALPTKSDSESDNVLKPYTSLGSVYCKNDQGTAIAPNERRGFFLSTREHEITS